MSTTAISLPDTPQLAFVPDKKYRAKVAAKKVRRGKWLLIAVPTAALVATALGMWLRYSAQFEETDNAFVEADVHRVSSRISGDVLEVLVNDNQLVQKGQPLAKLDPHDLQLKLEAAKTAFAQAAAQIPLAEATVVESKAVSRQAEAQLAASSAQLEKARLDFERMERLHRLSGQAISQQDFDAAQASFTAATANRAASVAAGEAAQAKALTAEANLAVAKAGREHAQAAVNDAELQLSYTTLLAPEAGRIGKRTLQTGQHVQPGQSLMAVVSPEQWIVANFKENQLSEMRAGQAVEITIDAIARQHFTGRVESFAPATGAKFTLLPPDNATGNFTKVVQRVPVKILLNSVPTAEFANRISPGLSANVTVRVQQN